MHATQIEMGRLLPRLIFALKSALAFPERFPASPAKQTVRFSRSCLPDRGRSVPVTCVAVIIDRMGNNFQPLLRQ